MSKKTDKFGLVIKNGKAVFKNDDDYDAFLTRISDAAETFELTDDFDLSDETVLNSSEVLENLDIIYPFLVLLGDSRDVRVSKEFKKKINRFLFSHTVFLDDAENATVGK